MGGPTGLPIFVASEQGKRVDHFDLLKTKNPYSTPNQWLPPYPEGLTGQKS